ncbi:hypothetical protein, partial [Neisseria sp. P0017.S002]|uniref:hypothetical protein n=1 Tax=Neisseria sp. P0017.S002 TaxID=3436778 RepID=UPI003F7CF7A5
MSPAKLQAVLSGIAALGVVSFLGGNFLLQLLKFFLRHKRVTAADSFTFNLFLLPVIFTLSGGFDVALLHFVQDVD